MDTIKLDSIPVARNAYEIAAAMIARKPIAIVADCVLTPGHPEFKNDGRTRTVWGIVNELGAEDGSGESWIVEICNQAYQWRPTPQSLSTSIKVYVCFRPQTILA